MLVPRRAVLLLASSLQPARLMVPAAAAAPRKVDPEYPGTAVERMYACRQRVAELAAGGGFDGDWGSKVRKNLLAAAGLRDLPDARPGQGYTGHAFNDFNHCDATTMLIDVADSNNEGRVPGIAFNNPLGNGIRIASVPELGAGGSWSTCIIGNNEEPPHDVAHVQFQSRIAFKLVWLPPSFESFALLDDGGNELATGRPTGQLPALRERQANYQTVRGGRYDPMRGKSPAA